MGFGRSGERVEKTPASGLLSSPRGWTRRTSRSARSSQVITRSSSPTEIPSSAGANSAAISRIASGEPSSPCLGAASPSRSGEETDPIARSSIAREPRSPAPVADLGAARDDLGARRAPEASTTPPAKPRRPATLLRLALEFVLAQEALEEAAVPLLVAEDRDHHVLSDRVAALGLPDDPRVVLDRAGLGLDHAADHVNHAL